MASFYEDASLVVIPSGYKTSKIYAEKPTDGSGDLTFTRASGATRVGANGLIEEVRTNLVLQSNTFSTTWVNSDSNETSGQAGYDGTNNAWRLTTTLSGGFIFQGVAISGITTFSIYAKAGTQNGIILYSVHVAQGINFNLSTGVVGAAFVAAPLGSRIESIGNGWYRCSITVSSSSTNNFRIYVSDGTNPSLGNVLIQNSQVEAGDIATNYIPTTTAAVSVGPVSNVPRLDYTNSSCPRLLLEPQRTNLFTFSESFDDSSWTKAGSTITANNATSPDGYSSADRIVETATTATHLILRSVALTAASHTFSCFIKAVSGSTRNVGLLFNTTGKGVIVNPSNGAVVLYSGTTAADVKIETYSNGWYRVAVTATTAAITESLRIYLANGTTWTAPYAGDGTSSALIWGAQVEAGAYATSYIPTLGATVTRVADAASKTGISSLLSASEYTLFWEGTHIPTGQFNSFMTIYNAANNAFSARFYRNNTNNEVRATMFNPSTSFSLDMGSGITASYIKCALRVKAGNYAFYVNGSLVNSSTNALAPSNILDSVNLQFYGSSQSFDQNTAQALFFKTGLTNAQLAELTTL
jgi:hypothetical protein